MALLPLVVIYIVFISLGLPDGVHNGAWPAMYSSLQMVGGYVGGATTVPPRMMARIV